MKVYMLMIRSQFLVKPIQNNLFSEGRVALGKKRSQSFLKLHLRNSDNHFRLENLVDSEDISFLPTKT